MTTNLTDVTSTGWPLRNGKALKTLLADIYVSKRICLQLHFKCPPSIEAVTDSKPNGGGFKVILKEDILIWRFSTQKIFVYAPCDEHKLFILSWALS